MARKPRVTGQSRLRERELLDAAGVDWEAAPGELPFLHPGRQAAVVAGGFAIAAGQPAGRHGERGQHLVLPIEQADLVHRDGLPSHRQGH